MIIIIALSIPYCAQLANNYKNFPGNFFALDSERTEQSLQRQGHFTCSSRIIADHIILLSNNIIICKNLHLDPKTNHKKTFLAVTKIHHIIICDYQQVLKNWDLSRGTLEAQHVRNIDDEQVDQMRS